MSIEKLIRPRDRLTYWLLRYGPSWPRPFTARAARAARARRLVAPALPALGQLAQL